MDYFESALPNYSSGTVWEFNPTSFLIKIAILLSIFNHYYFIINILYNQLSIYKNIISVYKRCFFDKIVVF